MFWTAQLQLPETALREAGQVEQRVPASQWKLHRAPWRRVVRREISPPTRASLLSIRRRCRTGFRLPAAAPWVTPADKRNPRSRSPREPHPANPRHDEPSTEAARSREERTARKQSTSAAPGSATHLPTADG